MIARWALFISGRGSTAQSVLDLGAGVNVCLVVSSNPQAFGLQRARREGIPTLVCKKNGNQLDYDWLQDRLLERGINRIFLAGFMRLLPPDFLNAWRGKIWNVHPSLLPAHKGAKALETSFFSGSKMGVSIHQVVEEIDAGKVEVQKAMDVFDSIPRIDTAFERSQHLFSSQEQLLIRHWFEITPGNRTDLERHSDG